jgi:transducin (beta)-like 1
MSSEKYILDLAKHSKEIYTLAWAPCGPGSRNPTLEPLLATASFDNSVKIWNPHSGKLVADLNNHTEAVYSIAFSPNGKYIASGAFDARINIWSLDDFSLLRTFTGGSGIFEVSWNSKGDKLASCYANNMV